MNVEQKMSKSSLEQQESYWLCWECGVRYPNEVRSCATCGSTTIHHIYKPKNVPVSCVTPPESAADENATLRKEAKNELLEEQGIITSTKVLLAPEIAQGFIGAIRKSWADSLRDEGGGRFPQACCWCGEVRQGKGYDHVVGPCEFCGKKLLIVSDQELDKRLTMAHLL